MATETSRLWLGKELREKWAKVTAAECEPLTFGDLKAEDQFIGMPLPGRNDGHGGLLGGHHLFVKKTDLVAYSDLSANAVRISDGTPSCFNDDLIVIKVD